MTRSKVGIIGYGRFGRLWGELLAQHHEIHVYDSEPRAVERFCSLAELCGRCDAIFLCVPINQVDAVVREIAGHVRPGTIVFDTCSVKTHPAEVMTTHLQDVTLVATHPMFGPDSGKDGVRGLPMVVYPLAGDEKAYHEWVNYFQELGIRTVELSPDEHDQLAAYSQGVTHYVGRLLRELGLHETPIDTQGFRILRSLIDQTCNDSWELFRDLQLYNPYTRDMRVRMEAALAVINAKLEARE